MSPFLVITSWGSFWQFLTEATPVPSHSQSLAMPPQCGLLQKTCLVPAHTHGRVQNTELLHVSSNAFDTKPFCYEELLVLSMRNYVHSFYH